LRASKVEQKIEKNSLESAAKKGATFFFFWSCANEMTQQGCAWNHAIFLFLQIYASGFIACEVIAAKWLKIKSTATLQIEKEDIRFLGNNPPSHFV
jgi:hypothetical protein